jgi:parallel beta-helix repeat protein
MSSLERSLMIIGLIACSTVLCAGVLTAADHYVSPGGDDSTGAGTVGSPWRHIGYAESQATTGDTIWVMDDDDAGTDDYVENIFIDIPITIAAYDDDGTRPMIRALFASDPAIRVHEGNVTLRGLDVYGATGSDEYGIRVDKRDGISAVVISDVVVDNCRSGWDASHTNYHGISFNFVLNGEIRDSVFSNNSQLGIHVNNSSSHSDADHVITGNTVAGNRTGIRLERVNGSTIEHNTVDAPVRDGIYLSRAQGNAFHSNQITNSAEHHGIVLDNESDGNTFTENTVTGHFEYGIDAYDSVNNLLYCNSFGGALGPVDSSGGAVNTWVSPSPETYIYQGALHTAVLGNRYGDYAGADANGDGIGDTPHTLPGAEPQDTAPLADGLGSFGFGAVYAGSFEDGTFGDWDEVVSG